MSQNAALRNHEHEIFEAMNDEQWCICYLYNLRWPDGFVCPFCGDHQPGQVPQKKIVCRNCGKLSSVTSGTLLHGSKKQLASWFQAVWWLIMNVPEVTIRRMQKELGFTSYQTAWTWMGKLRFALQIFVNGQSGGTVIVGPGALLHDQAAEEPHRFLVAVESIIDGRMTGKVQMARVPCFDSETIVAFIRKYIRTGSCVVVPNREPFTSVIDIGGRLYIIDEAGTADTVLLDLNRRFNEWYERKRYRPVSLRLTQGQLNEFCFTQTAHLYPNKRQLFDRVMKAAIEHGPVPARQLTGNLEPKRGWI